MIRTDTKNRGRLLHRFSLITLIAVYVLILVGGIVRSTGSGMGCPDWPKCFGNWVPPTDQSELPADYKDIYANKRAQKNVRFAKYLTALGFDDTANRILNDESILVENDFNKYKTWTEYVNRLVGVLIGFFILITFILSLRYLKQNKTIFFVVLATLLLVIFQGWIGSIVVSTNLVTWMVTIHMFLAMVIVALLVYLYFATSNEHHANYVGGIKGLLVACMATSLIQVFLGTQVREAIDVVAASLGNDQRLQWISNLGGEFIIHRSFSWVVLILHLVLMYVLVKNSVKSTLAYAMMATVLVAIISGVSMAYFGIPAFIQPVHLLLGTLIFGLQFLLFLQLNNKRKLEI